MTTYDTRHMTERTTPVETPTVDTRLGVVRADDGRELRATWFLPSPTSSDPTRPRGAVVVVPAMATPSTWYAPLATWLAGHGYVVLTFDYRGTGSVAEMRAERGDLLRWAHDAASALETLIEAVPEGTPVTWLGHSLGGQVLPFARHDLLDGVVTVAAGLGYVGWNADRVRRWAPLLFRVVAPLAIRVAGYYPGRRLRMLGDAPANVMRQWGRWCRDPRYYGVDVPDIEERAREVTVPIASISVTDDELLSARSIAELEALFACAPVESRRLDPAEHGLPRIGHHGLFHRDRAALWEAELLLRLAQRDD
ncbi:alpha/beta fold hydrolase [Nocardioides sp. SYSU D00038]|uniref:alpha/beta hydrolase family protein n=1 Tax=Nocardioides sp. SYSU D00038 TaxID=2812554 RepID=UPI001967FE97|nr:alpha/beta fold hydrolase [Nocardioides sp. SYSU D00038]